MSPPQPQQGDKLPFSVFSKQITLEDFILFPHFACQCDWDGKELSYAVTFLFAKDPRSLLLSVKIDQAPKFDRNRKKGEFVRGLWEQDVAEIFLCEDNTTRYQEFHLAPSGAWWSAVFQDYRVEEEGSALDSTKVETIAKVTETSWRAAMKFPLSKIAVTTRLNSDTRANISFVLGSGDPCFVSWSKLSESRPDFHLTRDFQCLALR